MTHLPLRAKVALWSALAAGLALGAALIGIHFFLRIELLEVIDQRMRRESSEIFWDLDRQPGGPIENRAEITEELMPPSLLTRLVEIYDRNGNLVYRSSNLHGKTLRDESGDSRELRLHDKPYLVDTYYHKFFTLHLGYPLGNYYATLKRVTWAIIVVLPGVVLFSVLGGCWVAARALRPVQKITETALQISAEDLHRRLPVPQAKDEIHQLTAVLNDTFSRLEQSYNQAMHFAADASHQLKTPITVMRAAIEDVLHDPTLKPEHASAISDLLQQTRRLSSLTEGLLLLARADAGNLDIKLAQVDLAPVVNGCLEDAEIIAATNDISITSEIPESIPAFADPMRTEQVILNLLENAVKYNEPGGTVRVKAEHNIHGTRIMVANTGRPIPKDKIAQIFNRFVRGETNESRSGHGLGLALARELARAQGGELSVVRSDDQWTEFCLRLNAPLVAAAKSKPATLAMVN